MLRYGRNKSLVKAWTQADLSGLGGGRSADMKSWTVCMAIGSAGRVQTLSGQHVVVHVEGLLKIRVIGNISRGTRVAEGWEGNGAMEGTSNASRTRGVAASGVAVTADVRLMHHANRNHAHEPISWPLLHLDYTSAI